MIKPDPKLDELDDIALMLKTREDDNQEAFATLVKRYQKKLLNFFIRSGVNYDEEDLVQDTFLRIYRYRKRYVASAQFTTFLFMIARQVWIDELRRRQRRQLLKERLYKEPEPKAEEQIGAGESASVAMDLAKALAALPPEMREVVELAVYQDLPYQEVADIMNIPVGTVKSRMFNALRKMRAYMDKGPQ